MLRDGAAALGREVLPLPVEIEELESKASSSLVKRTQFPGKLMPACPRGNCSVGSWLFSPSSSKQFPLVKNRNLAVGEKWSYRLKY